VLVERPIGDDGTPSRRIVLKTATGDDIPMTVGYRPDADGAVLHIASRIRVLLGHGSDATHMPNVLALIAAGKNDRRDPHPARGGRTQSSGCEAPDRGIDPVQLIGILYDAESRI
jgi:hypothetical protein